MKSEMKEIISIPVVDIYVPPFFTKEDYHRQDYLDKLKASIVEHGQLSPIIVRKDMANSGYSYTLAAGYARYIAINQLELKTIAAVVVASVEEFTMALMGQ
jgi:ParB family transcriptional regulator, chromosome partitioning protein